MRVRETAAMLALLLVGASGCTMASRPLPPAEPPRARTLSAASTARGSAAPPTADTAQPRPTASRPEHPLADGASRELAPTNVVPIWLEGVEPESPEAIALELLGKLRDGDVLGAAVRFDDVMWSSLIDEGLLHLWPQIVAEGGEFRGVVAVRREPAGWHDLVHVVCLFERGELDVRVGVTKDARIHGLSFAAPEPPPYEPPGYARPDELASRAVVVGDAELPGELTMPRGAKALPAIVLVHGSGPQDRDARMGALRPFHDLALGLASRGIAVLRYEKRTRHLAGRLSTAELDALTLEQESVADARAALRLLRREPAVDPTRLFVAGHSLGGVAALRLARSDSRLSGIVLLAAPARPLEDVILDQYRYLARLESTATRPARDGHAAWLADLDAKVRRVKELTAELPTPATELPLGIPARYWLDLAAQPAPALAARERRPILVLQGGRDYQVTDADYSLWERALRARPTAELERFPALNHAFVAGHGQPSPTDYASAGHVAREVVERIAAFVLR